jgi:uncharacterized membrane protein YjfL (UPF0719 family)
MTFDQLLRPLVEAALFSALGILVFALAFAAIVRLSPFSVRKEIEQDQNTSLAILIGSVFIGISLIIAAAIHG